MGRKILAFEMVSIAGPQYTRSVHELQWNVNDVCSRTARRDWNMVSTFKLTIQIIQIPNTQTTLFLG